MRVEKKDSDKLRVCIEFRNLWLNVCMASCLQIKAISRKNSSIRFLRKASGSGGDAGGLRRDCHASSAAPCAGPAENRDVGAVSSFGGGTD